MKTDPIEKFSLPKKPISTYVYIEVENSQYNYVCVGADDGSVYYFPLPSGQTPHNIRAVELTKDITMRHHAEVTCLLYSNNPQFETDSEMGIIVTGSRDRTLKIWTIYTNSTASPLLQSLPAHNGAITKLIDGKDGSFISIGEDGNFKLWSTRASRSNNSNSNSNSTNSNSHNNNYHTTNNLTNNNARTLFFECIFTMNLDKDLWLMASTMNNIGPWVCYVGDSLGDITLIRKDYNEAEVEVPLAIANTNYVKYDKWERVHDLTIVSLEIIKEENLLVSLSFDGTCKISDPTTGQLMFLVKNKRRCMFTGAVWVNHLSCLYMCDELGYLEVFSLFEDKTIEVTELVHTTSKQTQQILSNHLGQTFGSISKFSREGYYFILTASGSSHKATGARGNLVLWSLVNDIRCLEFKGHEGTVVSVTVPFFSDESNKNDKNSAMAENNSAALRMIESTMSTLNVSREEKLFFSAGHDDFTIRCWDEYDRTESYQFKNRSGSEIAVMIALWDINRIVTGHENGMVCLWNSDAGTKVVSTALKHTVSSIVEAKTFHSKILLGADYSGRIAMWNLTLHFLNPTQLKAESVWSGYHEPEDPSILCLSFHAETFTYFSGGNDTTIRYWRQSNDIVAGCKKAHQESICFLKCTKSFLLSGDEGGDINLYKILTVDSLSGHGSVIDSLMILSTWSCLVPTRAIADLVEVKATHAYVVQIGSGMNGRTKIYQIVVQNRSVRPKYIISGAKNDSDKGSHVYERHTLEDLILSTKQLEADPKFNRQKEKISPLEELDILDEVQLARKAQQTNFKSYEMDYMDIYLSIVELCSVNSDKYEITCCTLTYDYHKMLQRASFKSSCYLYVGTASGLILRYSFD